MSAAGECPDRVAIETPSGAIRAGRVVECKTDATFKTGPIQVVRVSIDGHILEVPAHEAQAP